jgi:hypothetical protein
MRSKKDRDTESEGCEQGDRTDMVDLRGKLAPVAAEKAPCTGRSAHLLLSKAQRNRSYPCANLGCKDTTRADHVQLAQVMLWGAGQSSPSLTTLKEYLLYRGLRLGHLLPTVLRLAGLPRGTARWSCAAACSGAPVPPPLPRRRVHRWAPGSSGVAAACGSWAAPRSGGAALRRQARRGGRRRSRRRRQSAGTPRGFLLLNLAELLLGDAEVGVEGPQLLVDDVCLAHYVGPGHRQEVLQQAFRVTCTTSTAALSQMHKPRHKLATRH